MTERTLADGDALFRINEEPNELYQVISGKIKCNMYSHDGKEVVISTLLSGETFGEQGLVDALPRATNTYSVGPSIVNVLNKKQFSMLCKKHNEINAQLIIMFSLRMRIAFEINTGRVFVGLVKGEELIYKNSLALIRSASICSVEDVPNEFVVVFL